jgi:nucleotide-binding universal stress UspA family protein
MSATSPIQPHALDHILVPLDGSRLAESALPVAISLAGRVGARVTLLHILERNAPAKIHGERHLTSVGEAESYLHGVASRFADAGIAVDLHTHPNPEGDVAASVAAHTAEVGATLIALCAHGRGGLREWFSGAIAQRVIRQTTAPVLLVRPTTGTPPAFAPATVLVALDGTAAGELALPPALALAQAYGASLAISIVIATLGTVSGDRAATARLTPASMSAVLDLESDEAGRYLDRLHTRLADSGLTIRATVGRGDPVRVVLDAAEAAGDSLVALATHGRTGLDALWSGSVGTRVVARAGRPLLLVPAAAPPATGADD